MKLPSSCRRWVSDASGASFRDAAHLRTVPLPTPNPNEALVRNKYATINGGHDTFIARREAWASSITGTRNLGADSLGQVVAVGSDVESLKVGDYVSSVRSGGYSEFVTALESNCIKVDSPEMEYAALRISGTLVCGVLEFACEVVPGKTLLVTAAAGGVGHLAVQLGKLSGCHVIGTCGGSRKKEIIHSLGADRVINYHEESIDEVLKREYPDGVDYVAEGVGGKLLKIAFDHLAPNGRLASFGHISQYSHNSKSEQEWDVDLAPGYPTVKQFQNGRINFTIGDKLLLKQLRPTDPKDRAHCTFRAFRLFKDQKWKVLIDHHALSTFVGIESVPDCIEYMLSGKSIGKVLLKIQE